MELPERQKTPRLYMILIGTAIICLLVGGIFGYVVSSLPASSQISDLQSRLSTLEKTTYENNTYVLGDNVSLSQLYSQVKDSVVVVQGVLVQYDYFGPYYS